ncbi:hypothetical protein K8O68_17945 [Salipaludibacillus sp. CUR1]|uniref:hypothetical protein n=1 Tax=Salipaludibacillus sp. CUR1 TaxID=2820003 RepID=UPI001E3357C7|nr:hypothetical protein [Salipaludibacillus sp. CUR1]MCE7794264.1 hypothetical protein [Salipaludibacillus sp. CUR1]
MKTFGLILLVTFAFLIIPIHYIAVLPLLQMFYFPKFLLILIVVFAFLGAILTAGYDH